MLFPFSEIKSASVEASDGKVGSVKDVYFDASQWKVRYVVVDTGTWLPGRQVLLPPEVLEEFDFRGRRAATSLSQKQVEESPSVDTEQPISRQMEADLMGYYRLPYYWGPVGASLAGGGPSAVPMGTEVAVDSPDQEDTDSSDLRSAKEVVNYNIAASDGTIGHVEDFLIDDSSWAARYFVVDTKNWLPGKKVVIAIDWIADVSWFDGEVAVDLPRDKIKAAPEFDPEKAVNRDYEESLYEHYGLKGYWLL